MKQIFFKYKSKSNTNTAWALEKYVPTIQGHFNFFFTDNSKIEVEFKSDVNSEILENLPFSDEIKKYGNDVLDMRIGETDMTLSQILRAFVEVRFFDLIIIWQVDLL